MSKVFEEVHLKHLTLKNRLVRSATQDPFGGPEGFVSDKQKELYRTIANNNVGMVITAHACVTPEGNVGGGQNGIYDDKFIAGQSEVATIIKAGGAAAVMQISHAGGNVMPYPGSDQLTLLAPVEKVFAKGVQAAKAMDKDDMEYVKNGFVEGAKRAMQAGFDGIQIHLAHGYLLSQFLNPCINTREDEYGVNAEGRFHFPKEVLTAVREAVGPDYPIFVKINSNCEENDEAFEQDFMYYMKELDKFGLEGIEVSGWNFTPLGRSGARDYFLERASKAAAAINTPVFLIGGMRNLDDMQRALDAGMVLCSMSRPFIAEPDLGTKLANGEESRCTSCSKCFYLIHKEGRRCILHPMPEQK